LTCSYFFSFPISFKSVKHFYTKNASQKLLFILITLWATLETLFFPYYYYLFVRLSKSKPNGSHYAKNSQERILFARNCFEALKTSGGYTTGGYSEENGKIYLQNVIEGWFFGVSIHDIKYGDLMIWLSWAFLGKDKQHLTKSEIAEVATIASYLQVEKGSNIFISTFPFLLF
jgi:hypothetical protein